MRFFEVAAPQRRVVATKRFIKNAKEWIRLYPDVGQTLADFLRFRETAPPTEGFSKKDAPFTGDSLKGYRHVHLRFGKVIVVYAIGTNELRLIDMVDHDTMDSDSFRRFITSVGQGDYQGFGDTPQKAEKPALAPAAREELQELLYGFAAHPEDRKLLIQTWEGQYIPMVWEMLRSIVQGDAPDAQKDKLVIGAYGGLKGFKAAVEAILRQTQ